MVDIKFRKPSRKDNMGYARLLCGSRMSNRGREYTESVSEAHLSKVS